MTSEQLLAPNKKIEVVVIPNPDEAYMTISFLGEKTLNYEGENSSHRGFQSAIETLPLTVTPAKYIKEYCRFKGTTQETGSQGVLTHPLKAA